MTWKIDVRPWDCWTSREVGDWDVRHDGPLACVLFRQLPACFGGPALNGMRFPMPLGEFKMRLDRCACGEKVEDVFFMFTPDEWEFIMTGITPEAWDANVPEE